MLKSILSKNKKIEYFARNLYYKIPDYYRYTSIYRNKYQFLQESEFWSSEKLADYQWNELKKIIEHAYKTVPYYKKLFKENNILPSDIRSFEDMKKIPYLTKEIVQKNLEDLISSVYDINKLSYVTTGGSTGIPMGFYRDAKVESEVEWAFVTNMWSRVGYNPKKNNKIIYLRGNVVEDGIYEYINNSLVLSSYHLIDKNMKVYIKLINEYEADFIQAYPSSIYLLAQYIIKNKVQINSNNLKAILCASENLYDFQKRDIEKAFKVRVYSFYGHTEHACIAGECELSSSYHLDARYGYTEVLEEYGARTGEIVATGFINYAMPFIRYKTADIAVMSREVCKCGRNCKCIERLQGREQEQIITNTGAKVAMTSIIFAQHFKAFGKIKNMQLEQSEIGKVIVKIVENEKLDSADKNEIINKMQASCSNEINVEIKIVDNINRTKSGKQRFLVQNLTF